MIENARALEPYRFFRAAAAREDFIPLQLSLLFFFGIYKQLAFLLIVVGDSFL